MIFASLSLSLSFSFYIAGVVLCIGYSILPSKKKRVVKDILGSSIRFMRSLRIGATISMDYLIAPLIGYTDTEIHRRSADRIVQGCLKNGGIYIKFGQGLAAINHVLPKEYIESLSTLQVRSQMLHQKVALEKFFH